MRSRRARARNQPGDDDEDDMSRYKENFAIITRIKTDIYSGLPIYVDVRNENLQRDPIDVELEHKKKQVWTLMELKIFFSILSEIPKQIWVGHSRLPYKTSKEILFFNQAFSGLMRFDTFQQEACQMRYQYKNQKERITRGLKDLIDLYLEPLYQHIASRDKPMSAMQTNEQF